MISNYHVVKDAAKVRLLTGAGLIDAKVVQVDAANDLALLKADGKFSPLPISSSRSAQLGGTVATVGFPDIGLQGFAPKVLAHGHHGGNRVAVRRGGWSLRTATNCRGKAQKAQKTKPNFTLRLLCFFAANPRAAAVLVLVY